MHKSQAEMASYKCAKLGTLYGYCIELFIKG